MLIDLHGARVVVTGAGGGVGAALVAAFSGAGASVVGCDIDGSPLPEGLTEAHRFDLRDRDGIERAAAAILEGGAPRIVVLNAGRTWAETLAAVTPEALTSEMDLNFTGHATLLRQLLPDMRGMSGDRAVVALGSVNALGHFGNPAYSAAKAALLAWMRALAVEEGRHGLRANAVVPASIRTHAWDDRLREDPGLLDRLSRLYPLGRIVTPEEVAQSVLFLASPMASGITGTTLTVDAGLSAGNLPFLDAITGRSPDAD